MKLARGRVSPGVRQLVCALHSAHGSRGGSRLAAVVSSSGATCRGDTWMSTQHGSRAALLLAVLVVLAQPFTGSSQAPKPKDVIPLHLGPVQLVDGQPAAAIQYQDLALVYDDYRRIKTRPLLHLEPDGVNASSPQLFLFSAFFDTRPLYYGQPAVLRMMALKYEPSDTLTPGVYCKYLVQGQDRYFVSKAHGPLRVNTNDAAGWPYRDVIYTCNTTIATVAAVEAAAAGGAPLQLPVFATLVSTPDQEVPLDLSWVHVSSIPLVHERAPQVNRVLRSAREPEGPPYLTPTQYHAGEGDIAVCAGPMYGGDHHGGVLAEWAEFQKLMGVTKVFIFDFSMGRISRHYVNLYQADGFFEVYDLLLSRRLLQPGAESQDDFCKERFPQEAKRYGQYSHEWVSGCAGSDTHYRVYLRAESALRLHCTYSTMGRYRWVAVIDLDEYMVPRLSPAVNWTGLFKQAMADKPGNFPRFGYQFNRSLHDFKNTYDGSDAPFPSSFIFLNTFVCTKCAGHYQLAPLNTSVNQNRVVSLVAPAPDLDIELRIPRPSLHPVTWAAVRSEVQRPMDRVKSISDPLATMSHYAHCPWSYWDMEGGTLRIPTSPGFLLSEDVALLYHVRVSHVSGINALKASHNADQRRLVFSLDLCTSSCGSPFTWRYDNLFEDWTIANLYGRQLVTALSRKFHGTTLHGAAGEDPAKQ